MNKYKSTLNLPATTMPIHANLPGNEPGRFQAWDRADAYGRMRRGGKEPFILHDGPPYANGPIHMGHALNKLLKDFVVKWQYFQGRAVRFQPGWDCHGLPIEQKAREQNPNSQLLNLRYTCREYARTQVEIQREQFRNLGVVADWDSPYLTMDPKFEAAVYRAFLDLLEAGMLAERVKPVCWSYAEQTALAEAEVEYKDKTDKAIYVVFQAADRTFPYGLLVMTTTPWTLPANVAVALNPDIPYVVAHIKNYSKPVLMADEAYSVLQARGFPVMFKHVVLDAKGFEGWRLTHPIFPDRTVPVVLDTFVKADEGTGCVHIAPGHGEIDYRVGVKNGLPVIMPVDPSGIYTAEAGRYADMHVFDANKYIIQQLEVAGHLLWEEEITHSYPHCWRSGTPAIYRATKQWFLEIAKLRHKALDSLDDVGFFPEQSKNRMTAMLRDRPDWCISRQRVWGVPIALLRGHNGQVIWNSQGYEDLAKMFEVATTDIWGSPDVQSTLVSIAAEPCDKIQDTLDVWFDSGLSWLTLDGQADLYLEGADQHRGWFQSSLWLSLALTGKAPFKQVVTHGFVMDSQGRKMSKQEGNVTDPMDVAKRYGVEVIRYWVATTDYTRDVAIGEQILTVAAEGHRKLRNSMRFLIANLPNEKPEELKGELMPVDWWIVDKAIGVFTQVDEAFGRYEFWVGMHRLMEFVSSDLSGIWMNAAKDRLYCDLPGSYCRMSAVKAATLVLENMIGLVAPIFTYTADEVLGHCPAWVRPDVADIFDWQRKPLQAPPRYEHYVYIDEVFWKEALVSFHREFDRLKTEGKVRDTLEVVLEATNVQYFAGAEDWFVVSNVFSFPSDCLALAEFQVQDRMFRIVKSQYEKCARCWKRRAGEFGGTSDLCRRCNKALEKKEDS